MTSPRIAIGPRRVGYASEAVTAAGGTVVEVDDGPEALVWMDFADIDGLADQLAHLPDIRWVQLPMAGIERVVGSGLLDDRRVWTCAKGAYAEPVAEHALTLSLAGLRQLPTRVAARSWGTPAGASLYDRRVTILGAGGIATALVDLLAPFRAVTTVVRRGPEPQPGADRTVTVSDLHAVLPGSLLVIVALALTPATRGIIGAAELALMDEDAWLVNVARGAHVDTDALVAALDEHSIGGAALDVTDPEPLPEGHGLWGRTDCIITPHTADTLEMVKPLLAERIRTNVARFGAGRTLVGLVDPEAGY